MKRVGLIDGTVLEGRKSGENSEWYFLDDKFVINKQHIIYIEDVK